MNRNLELDDAQKRDFTQFDGNAQGFRVLTKTQVLQDVYGLNLTIGTLAAYLKYPIMSGELRPDHPYLRKIGVFQSESDHLKEIRSETGLYQIRHPLAFLMEAADTICYCIMDVEDGFNSDYYHFNAIIEYLKTLDYQYVNDFLKAFDVYIRKIVTANVNYETSLMVNFRVSVIRNLKAYACNEFMNNLDSIEDGIYRKELIEDCPLYIALFSFCKETLFTKREVCSLELTGESVLQGLLGYFIDDLLETKSHSDHRFKKGDKLYRMISNSIRTISSIENSELKWFKLPDYAKLRMIVDYVSGMTDFFAVDAFQRLSGIKIG